MEAEVIQTADRLEDQIAALKLELPYDKIVLIAILTAKRVRDAVPINSHDFGKWSSVYSLLTTRI